MNNIDQSITSNIYSSLFILNEESKDDRHITSEEIYRLLVHITIP
jgi:hypothetical protein